LSKVSGENTPVFHRERPREEENKKAGTPFTKIKSESSIGNGENNEMSE
jgi:hypothetical protein